ncbi:MAG TPA: hypothetical protein VGM39_25050, partial [Kofleriaceae bacterium]
MTNALDDHERELDALRARAVQPRTSAAPATSTVVPAQTGPGLQATREHDSSPDVTDTLEHDLGLSDDNESELVSPKKARSLVRFISRLDPQQLRDVKERLARYRPGSGDRVAAKLSRLDSRVRPLVEQALQLGSRAVVDLEPQLQLLEQHCWGHDYNELVAARLDPRLYLQRYASNCRFLFATTAAALLQPHPRLTWVADSGALALLIERALDDATPRYGSLFDLLVALLHPADVSALVLRLFDLRRGAVDGVAVDAPMWRPEFVASLRPFLSTQLAASTARIGDRYVAQADRDATVGPAAIILSTPMDEIVRSVMLAPGVISLHGKIASATPATNTFVSGLRTILFQPAEPNNPRMWNWVRVTNVADPTPEEVAAALFDGRSERAYGLVASPPYFAVPMQWARAMPSLAWRAPQLQLDRAATMSIEESERSSTTAIAASDVASGYTSTVAAANTVAGTKLGAEMSAVVRDQLATHVAATALLIDATALLIDDAEAASSLAPARTWLASLAGAPSDDLVSLAPILVEQQAIVRQATAAIQQLAKMGAGSPPVKTLIADFATAIGSSHVIPIALLALERALAKSKALPTALIAQSVRATRLAAEEVEALAAPGMHDGETISTTSDLEDRLIDLEQNYDEEQAADLAMDAQTESLAFRLKSLEMLAGPV